MQIAINSLIFTTFLFVLSQAHPHLGGVIPPKCETHEYSLKHNLLIIKNHCCVPLQTSIELPEVEGFINHDSTLSFLQTLKNWIYSPVYETTVWASFGHPLLCSEYFDRSANQFQRVVVPIRLQIGETRKFYYSNRVFNENLPYKVISSSPSIIVENKMMECEITCVNTLLAAKIHLFDHSTNSIEIPFECVPSSLFLNESNQLQIYNPLYLAINANSNFLETKISLNSYIEVKCFNDHASLSLQIGEDYYDYLFRCSFDPKMSLGNYSTERIEAYVGIPFEMPINHSRKGLKLFINAPSIFEIVETKNNISISCKKDSNDDYLPVYFSYLNHFPNDNADYLFIRCSVMKETFVLSKTIDLNCPNSEYCVVGEFRTCYVKNNINALPINIHYDKQFIDVTLWENSVKFQCKKDSYQNQAIISIQGFEDKVVIFSCISIAGYYVDFIYANQIHLPILNLYQQIPISIQSHFSVEITPKIANDFFEGDLNFEEFSTEINWNYSPYLTKINSKDKFHYNFFTQEFSANATYLEIFINGEIIAKINLLIFNPVLSISHTPIEYFTTSKNVMTFLSSPDFCITLTATGGSNSYFWKINDETQYGSSLNLSSQRYSGKQITATLFDQLDFIQPVSTPTFIFNDILNFSIECADMLNLRSQVNLYVRYENHFISFDQLGKYLTFNVAENNAHLPILEIQFLNHLANGTLLYLIFPKREGETSISVTIGSVTIEKQIVVFSECLFSSSSGNCILSFNERNMKMFIYSFLLLLISNLFYFYYNKFIK